MNFPEMNISQNSGAWEGQAQTSRLQQLQRQFVNPSDADQKKLKKAAQEFESIFVQQLLDAMDKTIQREDSVMGGGSAEEYWRGMMNEQVAKAISTRPGGSGFGLAESIYRQMSANLKTTTETGAAAGAAPQMTQGLKMAPATELKMGSGNAGEVQP